MGLTLNKWKVKLCMLRLHRSIPTKGLCRILFIIIVSYLLGCLEKAYFDIILKPNIYAFIYLYYPVH